MTTSRLLLAGLPLALLSACTAPAYQSSSTDAASASAATGQDANLAARGEYLARIAGCNDCHTPGYGERGGDVPKDAWLTGSSFGFSGPWGTTYPANLRLKAAEMDEAGWMHYTGNLHTRPPMPDYGVRDMAPEDRRALYRFLRQLGPGGDMAPAYLPPGQTPPLPYMQVVVPPPSS